MNSESRAANRFSEIRKSVLAPQKRITVTEHREQHGNGSRISCYNERHVLIKDAVAELKTTLDLESENVGMSATSKMDSLC